MHTCTGEEVFEHCVRHRTCSCTTATPTCVRGWDLRARHHCCCCAQLLEYCEHLPLYSCPLTNMLTLTPHPLHTHTHSSPPPPPHTHTHHTHIVKVGNQPTALLNEDEFLEWVLREPVCVVWLPTLHRLATAETGTSLSLQMCSLCMFTYCL